MPCHAMYLPASLGVSLGRACASVDLWPVFDGWPFLSCHNEEIAGSGEMHGMVKPCGVDIDWLIQGS